MTRDAKQHVGCPELKRLRTKLRPKLGARAASKILRVSLILFALAMQAVWVAALCIATFKLYTWVT